LPIVPIAVPPGAWVKKTCAAKRRIPIHYPLATTHGGTLFHIVLHQPEIPQNTGSIGRLCANAGCCLHLVHPLGFEVTDARLRRAGLDYWRELAPAHYDSWEDFVARSPARRLWLATARGERPYTRVPYEPGDGIVLGRETGGLPEEMLRRYGDCLIKIPMPGRASRSLNQAQAAAIVLYEALRQVNGW
jgi:tRNA (cytidine/uridine-2'-O-)-methyltransferase